MKKIIIQGKVCYLKPRKYEWEKIKFTLWDYYKFSDSLYQYFWKDINYDYWWQVYSDYIFARKYLDVLFFKE